jgi:3-deoxy-D-manno-octulosonic-acid transferase
MGNFHNLAEQMKREGAALEVTGAEDLAAAISDLLADPVKRQQMGQKAARIISAHQQAFSANLHLAERYL